MTQEYTVVIHVRGGVAEVEECPSNISVEIIDWDNMACEECEERMGQYGM